ncbi:RteC domain-containing protein [Parabacteroides faecis]|uniref:RteC protein n=1 Tax=Parabacteroides faecis TaxID=1217282 RepID=A0ABR6KUH3_9BACT|nr:MULTISPECIES: RteC domain-containing protein [Parabacteroides]MBB4625160.1 hypothetical protein [Parabacteroides faecis]GGK18886.1 hypothetical protein GCM10007084_47710 [Parabacteroides faecis]
MIDFVKKLQEEIAKESDRVESSKDNDYIKLSLEMSHVLADAFDRLKEFIISYEFRSEEEEIDFFKDVKPRLFCKLIYYRKIYNIEMLRPVASVNRQKEYLNNELDTINKYTNKRLDFIRYFRSGATYLDKLYFLRGQTDTEQYLEAFYYELDPQFSTNCDFKVARILANDMLHAYLMSEIEKLEYEHRPCGIQPFPETRLTYVGPKNLLIEFIYGFDTEGYFGNVPLTQVASYIENVFNVRLDSNLSRAFSDMKIRNNPTQGLDGLKDALLRRMQSWKRKKKK